jgi:PTH1 family peptidyl-tRNA hydrolase
VYKDRAQSTISEKHASIDNVRTPELVNLRDLVNLYSYMFGFLHKLFGKRKVQEPDPMKYLIAGLGNMGTEYDNTRHNIGFDIIDTLASEHQVEFKNAYLGDIAEIKHKGRTLILLKPSTYVNRSGKAVNYWMQKSKVQKRNLLVVVDDMNLDFGVMRLRGKGSDGGHNGLKDINQTIGSDYPRLRIGIGSASHGRHVDFVLGKWSHEEINQLPDILSNAAQAVKSFAAIGLQHTMNAFNVG